MAIAPQLVKQYYENLSIEELEEKYEELRKHYCFDSKKEQIEYIINNYLDASINTNKNSTKIALEELLKEKTGKDYNIEPKRFEITLLDVIDYISSNNDLLVNYFKNLDDINENEKISFLIGLFQNKEMFNDFINDITNNKNINDIYNKYKEILRKYIIMNNRKG